MARCCSQNHQDRALIHLKFKDLYVKRTVGGLRVDSCINQGSLCKMAWRMERGGPTDQERTAGIFYAIVDALAVPACSAL
jgi:hypothetical protein